MSPSGAIQRSFYNNTFVFAPRKTYLKNERAARRENMSVSFANRRMLSLRQNKNPSFPGHAPGKDTLRAANAATKTRFTGRKRVKRKRLPVVFPSFSERGLTGENARANAVSGRALSPALPKEGVNGGENNRTSFCEVRLLSHPSVFKNAHFVSVSQCAPFVTLCGLLLSNLQK